MVDITDSMYVVHEMWTCHFMSHKDNTSTPALTWLLNGVYLTAADACLIALQAHCRALLEAEGTLQSVPSAAASTYRLGPGICHPCHLHLHQLLK